VVLRLARPKKITIINGLEWKAGGVFAKKKL
jgi:hypothetical protein